MNFRDHIQTAVKLFCLDLTAASTLMIGEAISGCWIWSMLNISELIMVKKNLSPKPAI
jgi:hypothetical protein